MKKALRILTNKNNYKKNFKSPFYFSGYKSFTFENSGFKLPIKDFEKYLDYDKGQVLEKNNLAQILSPYEFENSSINKNALLVENSECYTKIIFPDFKFSLIIDLSREQTIKQMIEEARKLYNKEWVLSISFYDSQGELIANSVQARMLTRLPNFNICIDGGEKLINCINTTWSSGKSLDQTLDQTIFTEKNLDIIEKLMFENNFSFKTAQNYVLGHIGSMRKKEKDVYNLNTGSLTYREIFKDYLRSKYVSLNLYTDSLLDRRERRIRNFLNLFFYMSLFQVTTLNLCTFVFFSWDYMEPITQCITYLNIIIGYYFWAITDEDYEMESMINWAKNREFFTKPIIFKEMTKEKRELEEMLK